MLTPFCLALLALGCVPHTGADQLCEHAVHEDDDMYQEEARVLLQTNLDVNTTSSSIKSAAVSGAANLSRHRTSSANISFAIVGASRQEYELRIGSGRPTHVRSKVILAFLNMLGFGCLGIDRCYMGQSCAGIVKGLTLGGLGFWTFLDYIGILVSCLMKDEHINYLGYNAEFTEASIRPAFWITMALVIFMCICGGGGTLFYREHVSYKLPAVSKASKPPRVTRKMRQKLAKQAAVPAESHKNPGLLAVVEDSEEDEEGDGEDQDDKANSETVTAAGQSRQEQDQHPAMPVKQHQKPPLPAKAEDVEGHEGEDRDTGTAAGQSLQKQDEHPVLLAEQHQRSRQKAEEMAGRRAAEGEAKRLAAGEERRKAAEEEEARKKAAEEDDESAQSDNLNFELYAKVVERR
eukprot:TRINITY_DN5549_c3_g1_i1.p1 TRINITY_DN5549_c3_g1~~TRINITY_DN5549_c3_g1_i1.p1  ORF type:complete len:406 (-),score=97.09 TRINITY_DN5549_c3_g1_i1:115-1332(-)